MKNCPVTAQDVKTALFIWGPETAVIKGKTTRIGPGRIPDAKCFPLPQTTRDFHSKVTLCVDFFMRMGFHSYILYPDLLSLEQLRRPVTGAKGQ